MRLRLGQRGWRCWDFRLRVEDTAAAVAMTDEMTNDGKFVCGYSLIPAAVDHRWLTMAADGDCLFRFLEVLVVVVGLLLLLLVFPRPTSSEAQAGGVHWLRCCDEGGAPRLKRKAQRVESSRMSAKPRGFQLQRLLTTTAAMAAASTKAGKVATKSRIPKTMRMVGKGSAYPLAVVSRRDNWSSVGYSM